MSVPTLNNGLRTAYAANSTSPQQAIISKHGSNSTSASEINARSTGKNNTTFGPSLVATINVTNLAKPVNFTGPAKEFPEPEPNQQAYEEAKKKADFIKPTTKVFDLPPPSRSSTTSNSSFVSNSSSLINKNSSNIPSTYLQHQGLQPVHYYTAEPVDPFSLSVAGFEGLGENGGLVPDVQVAAGPDHIFEMVNTGGEIYTKTGTSIQVIALSGLPPNPGFFNIATTDFISDPQILYDASSNRWFATILDVSTHSVKVGVSTSRDPTSQWNIYDFPFNSQPNNCADRPSVGISDDKFVISVNNAANNCNRYLQGAVRQSGSVCSNPSGCSPEWRGAQYTVVSKSDLIRGVTTPASQQFPSDLHESSIQPVRSLSSTSTLYMVETKGRSIRLFSLTGTVPNVISNFVDVNIQAA